MKRPNILFITAEDICPNLGVYGDPNAHTPNLDRFSEDAIRFTNMYSVHPCCSPSRSCIMTGMYPTRIGTHQHRGIVELLPEDLRTMTSMLRDVGYYTFNGLGCEGGSAKADYNYRPKEQSWDVWNPKDIEWRNRKPGQPFFGQVNFFQTHQSQYGLREPYTGEYAIHHPDTMVLPDFHPDLPGVREIWCEYHERMTLMDSYVGGLLELLEHDGLKDDTIVLFLGDNGMGIPGGKVWVWEQGLHVPFMVHIPDKYKDLIDTSSIGVNDDMTSFLDIAPTLITWCGVTPPDNMQGERILHGKPRDFIYAARDLHEESDFDFSRVVRTKEYHYIRNFMPHIGWEVMPYSWGRAPYMLNDWYNAAKEGLLKDDRTSCFFINEKPVEELYDVVHDPNQMNNLAEQEEYQEILQELRQQCEEWIVSNYDLGFLSQTELYQRSKDIRTYHLATNNELNPVHDMLKAANIANERTIDNLDKLLKLIAHKDAAIRRWGAIGLTTIKEQDPRIKELVEPLLEDSSSDVRCIAAQYLIHHFDSSSAYQELRQQLIDSNGFVRYHALLAIARLGDKAEAFVDLFDQAVEPCENRDWGSFDQVTSLVSIIKENLDPNQSTYHKVDPPMYKASQS